MEGGAAKDLFQILPVIAVTFCVGGINGRKVVLAIGALLFGAAGMLPGQELQGQGLPKEPTGTPGPLPYPNPTSNPSCAETLFTQLTSVGR